MGLDLRLPIGLMFVLLGLLLAGFGLVSDESIYAKSLGVNINLLWGLTLFLLGVVLLVLARYAARKLAQRIREEQGSDGTNQ